MTTHSIHFISLFRLAASDFYMHESTDRMTHTTAFLTPVVEHWLEREIAQWIHHEGSIHRTMSERSYHGATSRSPLGVTNMWYNATNVL